MRFGLPEQTVAQIQRCIVRYPDIVWVKIYGSRVMGTHKTGSDIDLAFSGPNDHSLRLSADLAELPTPYIFDVVYYDSLENESLKAHIKNVGQFLIAE